MFTRNLLQFSSTHISNHKCYPLFWTELPVCVGVWFLYLRTRCICTIKTVIITLIERFQHDIINALIRIFFSSVGSKWFPMECFDINSSRVHRSTVSYMRTWETSYIIYRYRGLTSNTHSRILTYWKFYRRQAKYWKYHRRQSAC